MSSMAYLLDTSMLAEVLRSTPCRAFVRRLSMVPGRDRWTSVVSVSQLLVAARRTQQPRLMQDVVNLVAGIRVASFDVGAAQSFAKFRATVAPDIDADDVMIAATAASLGFVLVSKRARSFSIFPHLRVEDWTA
jgi:tRNA(fMet)-specific endonuclease VapC